MSYLAARAGPSSNASRTTVLHDSQPREERSEASGDERGGSDADRAQGVLRLRGGPRSSPRVAWTEDVVDNEGMGKKKSKICCIYHKPRRFDESSSESSGSDGSDADSDSSCGGRAQPRGRLGRQNRRHRAHRPHPEGGDGSKPSGGAGEGQAAQDGGGSGSVASQEVDSEPNAYEKQPPVGKGKNGKGKGRAGQAQDH